jgi:hypothetical protein
MTDTIQAVEEKTELKAEAKTKKPAGLKKYKIMFHEQDGDKSDVTVVHNYVVNTYQRGKWVEIDENFLSVVRDAKLETTRVYKDPATESNVTEVTSRPALQFSVDVI